MMLETVRLRLQRQVRALRKERLTAKRLAAETRDLVERSRAQAMRRAEPSDSEDAVESHDPSVPRP